MAMVEIQSVQADRLKKDDFGISLGGRIYKIRYDIPDVPQMDEHVHTIPAAALANFRIDTSEEDAMVAMDYYLREVMTSIKDSHDRSRGLVTARIDESPAAQKVKAQSVVRGRLEDDIFDMASQVPGGHPREVQDVIEQMVVTPVALFSRALAPALAATRVPTERLDTAQHDYSGELGRTVAAHAVDTSVAPWTTLSEMVAEDAAELRRERLQWFDTRYGERIRLRAGMRFRGSGQS